jgi:hypothetical protein
MSISLVSVIAAPLPAIAYTDFNSANEPRW